MGRKKKKKRIPKNNIRELVTVAVFELRAEHTENRRSHWAVAYSPILSSTEIAQIYIDTGTQHTQW